MINFFHLPVSLAAETTEGLGTADLRSTVLKIIDWALICLFILDMAVLFYGLINYIIYSRKVKNFLKLYPATDITIPQEVTGRKKILNQVRINNRIFWIVGLVLLFGSLWGYLNFFLLPIAIIVIIVGYSRNRPNVRRLDEYDRTHPEAKKMQDIVNNEANKVDEAHRAEFIKYQLKKRRSVYAIGVSVIFLILILMAWALVSFPACCSVTNITD